MSVQHQNSSNNCTVVCQMIHSRINNVCYPELFNLISSSELESFCYHSSPVLFLLLTQHLPILPLLSLLLFFQSFNSFFSLRHLFLLSSVFFEGTHLFSFCCLPISCFCVASPVFVRLHTSHPYLYPPSSTDFNYCFLPEAVSLSLLSLLYNVSHCFFFFFHKFHLDWILPVAQHLYNKAYILGYSLSTRLPSHWIFVFCIFDHIPLRSLSTITLYTRILVLLFRLSQGLWMRYINWHNAGVQENDFQAPWTAFDQGNVSLS